MNFVPSALGVPLVVTVLTWGGVANAYCLTTTCKPDASCETSPESCCIPDDLGCDINGIPLYWPTTCVSYAITRGGSEVRKITANTLGDIVDRSFSTWLASDCFGSPPAVSVENLGMIACDRPEYSSNHGNANLWSFRDSRWEHATETDENGEVFSSALAYTTISYDPTTGEIYDADVELNSEEADFTTSSTEVDVDLESVVIHEAGHFLGLDHSRDLASTMTANYTVGTTTMRSLAPDDVAGMCAAFPRDRKATENPDCSPRHGFSGECAPPDGGCAIARSPNLGPLPLSLLAFGAAVFTRRKRRG